jgi:hypothetical protein
MSTNLSETPKYQILWSYMRTDRHTHMAELMVAFLQLDGEPDTSSQFRYSGC